MRAGQIWSLEERGWRHHCKTPPFDSTFPAKLERPKEGEWVESVRRTGFYSWQCPECLHTHYMRREMWDADLVRTLRGDLDD